MLAEANSISLVRVDEVIELVGLSHVSRQRAGKFSLGTGRLIVRFVDVSPLLPSASPRRSGVR